MKRLVLIFLGVFLLAITSLKAQNRADFDLEQFVEELFSLQEDDVNYEDLYESLLLLYQNPLDLNDATTRELQSLYILSIPQINSLQTYIQEKGKLLTLFELQLIDGFDNATIQRLIPFVTVDPNDAVADERPLLKRILEERNNYFITRYERVLEDRRGYTPPENPDDSRYAGSPDKLYLRYRVSKSQDFSLGFTTEKDPGEALTFDGTTKRRGMDFWSAHFMLEKQGKLRKAIIGDYQLQFGQGLLFGAGLGVGKGSETVNTVQRVTLGIKPYTSVLEGGFLRGAAATYEATDQLMVTGFYSRLNQDANIRENDDPDGFPEFFSSFQLSGLHRTQNEISNKRVVSETVLGANAHYSFKNGATAGLTLTSNQFGLPIQRTDAPYNQFEFQGTSHYNIGTYASYNWRNFSLFGEGAIAKSGGFGGIAGFITNLSPRVDFAMVFRSYDRDFHSFRGTAFAEGSRNINESGVYWGVKYTLNRQFYLTAYYDTYRFPWLRFRVNAPSEGNDYLVRLHYNPGRRVRLYGQFRKETKDINTTDAENGRTIVAAGTKTQFVTNLEFSVTSDLKFKSRVQYSDFKLNGERTDGYAFIQDAVYSIGEWTFSGRMALFDTEGNENRQYAYERDVLYAFSIPAYSGRGIRNYFLLQYRMSRKIDIWARIARTTFYDRNEIGTGLETIQGDKRTEVKLQVRYKLK
ncbi:MAG: helix-hairpin-helix domain-containing protein [Roseivirga sp.]|nr:helix-hairpin-helix domain-containing protein [Roseivirga sp.]